MKLIDPKDLIAGLLTIILSAASIGKLSVLHDFAKVQAIKSLRGWEPHYFFQNPAHTMKTIQKRH